MNNEPVAWWTGKFEEEGEDFMFPKTRQAHIDHPQSCTHEFFPIPLYTHPSKDLTDEEIIHIWNTCETDNEVEELVMKDFILFARAILRKAQE